MALFNISERIIRYVLPFLPSFKTLTDDAYRDVKAFRGVQAIKCNAFLRTRQPNIRFRKGNYRRVLQSSIPQKRISVSPNPLPLVNSFRVSPNFESSMTKYPELFLDAPKKPSSPHVPNRTKRKPNVNESDKARQRSLSYGYYTNSITNYPEYLSSDPRKPFSRNTQNSKRANKLDKATEQQKSMASSTCYTTPRAYPIYLTGTTLDKVVSPSFQNSKRSYAQKSDKETGEQESTTSFGKRVGKLDAANEQGHFHQVNQSKLEKLKQLLAEKEKLQKKEAAKDSRDDEA